MADKTWTGLGLDELWSNGQNWTSSTVPVATDNIIFDGAVSTKNCNVNVSNIQFGTFVAQNGYSGVLTLTYTSYNAKFTTFTVNSNFTISGNHAINCTDLTINTGYTLTNIGSDDFVISGNFVCDGISTGQSTYTVTGTTQVAGSLINIQMLYCIGDLLASNYIQISDVGSLNILGANYTHPTTLITGYGNVYFSRTGTTTLLTNATFQHVTINTGTIIEVGTHTFNTVATDNALANTIIGTLRCDDGGTISFSTDVNINATGILGKINTAYNLTIRMINPSVGATLYAPNSSGTWIVNLGFKQPTNFYHSNGKVRFQNSSNYILTNCNFYDVEISTIYNFSSYAYTMTCNNLTVTTNSKFWLGISNITINGIFTNNGSFGKTTADSTPVAYVLIVNGSINASSTGTLYAPTGAGYVQYNGSVLNLTSMIYSHTNGTIQFNGTGAQSIVLPTGNVSTFYNVLIGVNSETTVVKKIVVNGTKTGIITKDQVATNFLTINNITINGILHSGIIGWTGIINGITDPSYILGTDMAIIKSVNGTNEV